MNRREVTKKLTDILVNTRLNDRKYYAKEVTLDYGTRHPKRIDVVEFCPAGVTFPSEIEKGHFVCYEIKSCKDDLYSGNGLNFYGEKNYIVTTMSAYKDMQEGFRTNLFLEHLRETNPQSSLRYGVMVAVPYHIDLKNTSQIHAEYENPTPFEEDIAWQLYTIVPCRAGYRSRSIVELLFYMLRSKHSSSNVNDYMESARLMAKYELENQVASIIGEDGVLDGIKLEKISKIFEMYPDKGGDNIWLD